MAEREERIKQIFVAALDLTPEERAAFVAQACGGDEELHRQVLGLFEYHDQADSRLESPVSNPEVPLAALPLPERIADFRVLGLLGRGGMGVVYLVERSGTGDRLALKMVHLDARSPEAMARFQREAAVLRRLDHPGIARFQEAGVHVTAEGPLPYLLMEVVEGVPLTQAAAGMERRERLQLLVRVCDAVAHAHDLGIVHRDLKPDNILVGRDCRPKILDFGVSRVVGHQVEAGSLATRTGILLGTIQYMSPEQARGEPDTVGPASDVYSLGVIAFELLAGQPPYDVQGVSLHRAMVIILTTEAPALGSIQPSLRGELEHVVSRSLEKRPEDRYPTATQLAADLQRYLEGRHVLARPAGWGRRAVRGLRRHASWTVVAITTAAILSTIALVLWRSNRLPHEPADPRAALAALCDSIVSADQKLHQEVRTRAGIRDALAMLEEARKALTRIPPQPFSPDLRRYTLIRSGEALFFLGSMDHDPEVLLQARAYFDNAAKVPLQADALAAMDPVDLRERIRGQTPLRPTSLHGITSQALATYRTPMTYSRLACGERTAVVHLLSNPTEGMRRFSTPEESTSTHALAVNELGETVVHLGATTLDAAMLEGGIRMLQSRYQERESMPTSEALGSLLFNLGVAFLRRAEMSRSPADLDSSFHYLNASLAYRPPERRLVHAETRRTMAEMALLAAAVAPTPEKPARLEEAQRHLDLASQVLLPDDHPVELALLQLLWSEALAEAALAHAEAGVLPRADSLLDAASSVFTRTRYPLQLAQLELRRAIVAHARWALERDPSARERVSGHLRTARDLVPEAQDPRFHRRLEQEATRLAAAAALDTQPPGRP